MPKLRGILHFRQTITLQPRLIIRRHSPTQANAPNRGRLGETLMMSIKSSWCRGLAVATIVIASGIGVTSATSNTAVKNKTTWKTMDEYRKDYVRPTSIPFPAENPYSAEKVRLGEMLFFDPRLSGSNYISCASCHNPSMSWGDGLPRGIGHGMTILGRRTPTVLNSAWTELLMWDGRKVSLEDQAMGPIAADVEMNQPVEKLVEKLSAIETYKVLFNIAFPGEGINLETIAKAIATFERTIVSGIAPFDRWIAGDEHAISESAKRGFYLFNTKANCATCHSGWNLTDGSFQDIGMPDADVGRIKILDMPRMNHAFKTPTLRDVSRRGPYMHDGSIASLTAVMEHYNRGGDVKRESLSEDVRPLNLSAAEITDVVEFMKTLTGDDQPIRLPILPMADQSPAKPTTVGQRQ
jgi:cytochrome c peroxidase